MSRSGRATAADGRAAERLDEIRDYYRLTDRSFAHWGGEPAYAMHYGFHDDPALSHVESLARMNAAVAERAKIRAGETVLDAGCGVGSSAFWLARHLSTHVFAISVSEVQIRRARRLARALDPDARIEFLLADYERTPLPDASVDVVWALESLCHAPDKAPFLREAARLLRPQGRLVVADYFLERAELDEVATLAIEKWTTGWRIAVPPTVPAFTRALERAGLRAAAAHDFTDAIRPSSAEMFARGKQGYPDDLLTKSKNVVQIRHVEACMFQEVALELGLWRYRVITAER